MRCCRCCFASRGAPFAGLVPSSSTVDLDEPQNRPRKLCMRLWACSNMAASTVDHDARASSPRCTGRQCMKVT